MEDCKDENCIPYNYDKRGKFIVVFIPDFNINTQGKDIPDSIEMARDAIGLIGTDMEDDGEVLPDASSLDDVRTNAPSNSIVSLVDVDFDEYRKKMICAQSKRIAPCRVG